MKVICVSAILAYLASFAYAGFGFAVVEFDKLEAPEWRHYRGCQDTCLSLCLDNPQVPNQPTNCYGFSSKKQDHFNTPRSIIFHCKRAKLFWESRHEIIWLNLS
jgi:hypothetical protein